MCNSYKSILMKRLLVSLSLLALAMGGNVSYAQVAESADWATRIKAEGLGRSRVEELAQYMTDYVGSRLTASLQKRRAMSHKLRGTEPGLLGYFPLDEGSGL